jgi:hypothetical protein
MLAASDNAASKSATQTRTLSRRDDEKQLCAATGPLVQDERRRTRPLKLTWPSVAALLRVHAA